MNKRIRDLHHDLQSVVAYPHGIGDESRILGDIWTSDARPTCRVLAQHTSQGHISAARCDNSVVNILCRSYWWPRTGAPPSDIRIRIKWDNADRCIDFDGTDPNPRQALGQTESVVSANYETLTCAFVMNHSVVTDR